MTWLLANWKLVAIGIALAISHAFAWRTGGAGAREDLATYERNQAEARLLADRAQRTEEQRRAAALAQEASNAQARIASLEDDIRRARAASGGVRDAATGAAIRARAQSCAPSSSSSKSGADPVGLLVDVLGRADQRAGEMAEYADRLRIAGIACERSYDALSGLP